MEYATGVITNTSDLTSTVSILINGRRRVVPFSRTIFYTYGMKCDGSISNILEEDMEVDLCYEVFPSNGKPSILAVWCGDPPKTIDDTCTSPNLYDQKGYVSYSVDDENFLVRNNGGHHTVMINTDDVYRDGCRLKDVGAMVSKDDEVTYDATPLDFEHLSGATYQATCAWLGPDAPRLMDRFQPQSLEECDEVLEHEVHGVVVTIPNNAVAVVEVMLGHDAVKVFLFRSSFLVDCSTIRNEVSVGDVLRMRLGYCIVSGRKLLVAGEAVKLYQELPKSDVPAVSRCYVTEDETELSYILPRTDLQAPKETQNRTIKGKHKPETSYVVPKNNAELSVPAPCNGVSVKSRSTVTIDEDKIRCSVPDVDSRNGLFQGKDKLTSFPPDSNVTAPYKAKNCVAESSDGDAAANGPTKHFNHVRSGTISGRSLLGNPTQMEREATEEKKIRYYVGVDIKAVKSNEGVKEIIQVPDIVSTYSAVVQVSCNSKPSETCKSKPKVADTTPKMSVPGLVNKHATTRSRIADRTSSIPRCKPVVADTLCEIDSKPNTVNVNGVTAILSESHIGSKPSKPNLVNTTPENVVQGLKVANNLGEKPNYVSDLAAIPFESHIGSKPCKPNVVSTTPENFVPGLKVANNLGEKPNYVSDLAAIPFESHIGSKPCKPNVVSTTPENFVPGLKVESNLGEKPNYASDLTSASTVEMSCKPVVADESEVDSVNVNGVTFSESDFARNSVPPLEDLNDPPILYMNDPPLRGVFSRYSLDCGMIACKTFKIFVKPDNFYIDGVPCPLKHFIKFAKPGKSMVNFEAVAKSSVTGNTDFTHEATCAWVGRKPSLVDICQNLSPPNLNLLELHDQDFCGTVSKLCLPDCALVEIQGTPTTVIVHVRSFTKPLYASSVGHWISDYVKLNDDVMFKVKDVDSTLNLLVAWDVRNRTT